MAPAAFAGSAANDPHVVGRTAAGFSPDLDVSDAGMLTADANAENFGDSTSTITNYSFDFGDGTNPSSGAGPTAVHTFAKPGTYSVTVTVTDAAGATSTATSSYTTQASDYTAFGPTRFLDTRIGTGAPKGAVAANGVVNVKVAGVDGIPANATAVVVNLTAVSPTQTGYIKAYGHGDAVPSTSAVDFEPNQTIPNLAIIKLGSDGSMDLLNVSSGTVQLLADVAGYFQTAPSDGYTALNPARILDTRIGVGAPKAPVAAGTSLVLTVAGADGGRLPATGIAAVALNLTVTQPAGGGYITAFPDGTTRPIASNIDFAAGQSVPNMVIVPVGADGKIDLYNGSGGTVHLLADVAGYFSADGASAFLPVPPFRVADSRYGVGIPGPATSLQSVSLQLTDPTVVSPLYQNMTGFVLNVTIPNAAQGGYVIVYPHGTTRPTTSNLDFPAGATVANLTLATPGSDAGKSVDFYDGSAGNLNVIADLSGAFGTY